jgi:hypothetical protein
MVPYLAQNLNTRVAKLTPKLKIVVFWDVTSALREAGNKLHKSTGTCLPDGIESHPRKT